MHSRKVILVIIDALATEFVGPAIQTGRLPNFKALKEAGSWQGDCTSIFPSITPAATASLVSGEFPDEHGIGGAYWYVSETDEVEYFGDDFWAVLNRGAAEYFRGFQQRLNYDRFQAQTVYEMIEDSGRESACLNYMWFKGPVQHKMEVPLPFNFLPGIPSSTTIDGPTYAALGDFVRSRLPNSTQQFSGSGGMFGRYGFQDKTTGEFLLQLAEEGSFPDFTLAYFPDNDFNSHDVGPDEAISTVERVDEVLGKVIERCGGLETFLDEFAIVITGDHSQSLLRDDGTAGIDLSDCLSAYNVTPAGQSWGSDDDLMVCPNMRAAEVYLRPHLKSQLDSIRETLLGCAKVDQVIGGDDSEEQERFCVQTADRGMLRFRAVADSGSETLVDKRGQNWEWRGDLSALDTRIGADNVVEYGDYPNAMQRIARSLTCPMSTIWLTARPGFEFELPRTEVHNRGSHGSLHRLDSTSPLITAGLPAGVSAPDEPSITDVVPLCLAVFGIDYESVSQHDSGKYSHAR